jgi:hypothetical protein
MDETRFHPELTELLEDPITHRMMASDKVDMASLVDLLRAASGRLKPASALEPRRRQ